MLVCEGEKDVVRSLEITFLFKASYFSNGKSYRDETKMVLKRKIHRF